MPQIADNPAAANATTPSEYINVIRGNLWHLHGALQEHNHPEAETVEQLLALCNEALKLWPTQARRGRP